MSANRVHNARRRAIKSFAVVALSLAGAAAAPGAGPVHAADTPLAISTSQVDFGTVVIGETASQAVTVTNTGAADWGPIQVDGSSLTSAPFTGGSNCLNATLAPGATCNINLSFTPQAAGSFNDVLGANLYVNDPVLGEVFTINVTGIGENPPAPECTPWTPAMTPASASEQAGGISVQISATQSMTDVCDFGVEFEVVELDASNNPVATITIDTFDRATYQKILDFYAGTYTDNLDAPQCRLRISFTGPGGVPLFDAVFYGPDCPQVAPTTPTSTPTSTPGGTIPASTSPEPAGSDPAGSTDPLDVPTVSTPGSTAVNGGSPAGTLPATR